MNNLLQLVFRSLDGKYEFNIGCSSSAEMDLTDTWHDSKTTPLEEVGGLTFPNDQSSENLAEMTALYDSLTKAGYGSRVGLLSGLPEVDVKLYLNGNAFDSNGVAQPYIELKQGSWGYAWYYYKADNTSLGKMFHYYYGSSPGPTGFLTGKLYDNGKFTGYGVSLRPKTIGGVNSHKYYEWKVATTLIENSSIFYDTVFADIQEYLPISPEGEFNPESGIGEFDARSDSIGFPELPSISALDTGMCAMYLMSGSELQDLSHFLWDNNFINSLLKMFNDPMEAILNLAIVPVSFLASNLIPSTTVKVGNVSLTGVTGDKVISPYKIIDFGTLNINEYWGSFADYSPYTRISIFLPYVGVQQLSIDDVMGGSIQLKAYCDVLTGSVQYCLLSKQGNPRNHGHNSVLYTWGGNMQYQIPLSASNFSQVVSSLIGAGASIAGGIGAIVASGGMTAPIAIGTATSAISNVMNAKTHIQRGGGLGGAVGLFGVQTPYLIMERPEQIKPENYNNTVGIPNETTDYIKNYSGYLKVKGVHIEINGAYEEEAREIERMLKEGVIV